MLDFQLFRALYYTVIFITVLVVSVGIIAKRDKLCVYSSAITSILSVFCILVIGFRDLENDPNLDKNRDTANYSESYEELNVEQTDELNVNDNEAKDYGYWLLNYLCKLFNLPTRLFFLICATLYITPVAIFSRRLSKKYAFLIFLMFTASMSFLGAGANIMRNGLASSLLLLAFVNYKKLIYFVLFAILAISMHKSVMLPLVAFIIARIFHKSKWYIALWAIALPLSFFIKDTLTTWLLGSEFFAERVEGYLLNDAADMDLFSHTGVRYDFILYSMVPIVVGGYFILKKNFEDKFYSILYATYLLSNSFWIIINDVPFSDRFAYLSWFIMPVLIIYPFLFSNIKMRYSKIALVLILQISFTLAV